MKNVYRELAKTRRGPKVEVTLHKLALLLRVIEAEGPIGRYSLVDKVRLGEGVIRSLLTSLSTKGLLKSRRGKGCVLTEAGRMELCNLLKEAGVVSLKLLKDAKPPLGRFKVAAHLKKMAEKVRFGVEQRDEAIKVGAGGALTFTYSDGGFMVPGTGERLKEVDPSLDSELSSLFKVEEGDVVVVCLADERWVAEEASLAVAFSLRKL